MFILCVEILLSLLTFFYDASGLFDKYFFGFVLLWAQLRRYCYIEDVIVFRRAVSALESFEKKYGIGLSSFDMIHLSPLQQIDITFWNKKVK